MTKTYSISQNGQVVMSITITQPEGIKYTNIQWDSRTGLVTANVNDEKERKAIPYEGNPCGKIEPGPFEAENLYDIDYNYWYY